MNEAQIPLGHTPGPWPEDYARDAVRHIVRNCDFIGSDTNPEFGWDRFSGDANLIAAAPDLLVVARQIEEWMLCDQPRGGGRLIGALADAIAKAEGRDAS